VPEYWRATPIECRPFLHEPGLVNHQHAVGIAQRLDDISTDVIAQGVRRPLAAAQQRLHPIRALKTGLLRQLPARFTFHT
jgi:hypothetical protein